MTNTLEQEADKSNTTNQKSNKTAGYLAGALVVGIGLATAAVGGCSFLKGYADYHNKTNHSYNRLEEEIGEDLNDAGTAIITDFLTDD
jgi:hypothetical protein